MPTTVTSSVDRSAGSGSLRLHALNPRGARVGEGFNIQPDGRSALSVRCENVGPWTTIVLDGMQLETAYGGPTCLSAVAPPGLTGRPGCHRVHLVDEVLGVSNELEFVVQSVHHQVAFS